MIKAIPHGVAAYASQKVSFRGEEAPEKGTAPESAKMAKIDAEKIRTKGEEIAEGADAIANTVDRTTNSVTNAVTKTTGAFALITGAFAKLIPAPIKDFFATPQYTINEAGEKILEKVKGSDGIERVVRKFNGKNTAIAIGVTALLLTGYVVYKHFKNKNAQPKPEPQPQVQPEPEPEKAAA